MKPQHIEPGSPDLCQDSESEINDSGQFYRVEPAQQQLFPAKTEIDELDLVTRYRLTVIAEEHTAIAPLHLDQPTVAASFFWQHLHDRPQEVLLAAFVDVRNRLIGWQEAYVGTLTRTPVEPRAILQGALLVNAVGFLLGHNHPSGDPAPSAPDQRITRRIADAGDIVGVRLVDHIIIGAEGRWVSLRRRGTW